MPIVATSGRYAIEALLAIAAEGPGRVVRVVDVACARGIPERLVIAALDRLRVAGLVDSRRGCEGGFVLARSPDRLTLHDILTAAQGEVSAVARDPQGGGDHVALDAVDARVSQVMAGELRSLTLRHLMDVECGATGTLDYVI